MVKRLLTIASVASVVLMQFGCGYSLAGRGSFLPTYIRTIGVPQFANLTPLPDVDRRVTEKVRAELIGRGKWTIKVDTVGVDAILNGEVTAITITPSALNLQQQATRYSAALIAKVEFKDLKANKVLWSNPSMQYREEFDVNTSTAAADASTFFGQDLNALDRMATEFARSVVSAILEAF